MTITDVATPEAKAPDAVVSDKPLNTTQVRNLQKLIKNDYDALLVDIGRAAEQRTAEAVAEVKAQWAKDHPSSSAQALADAANKAARHYNSTINRLYREASLAGVEFDRWHAPARLNADVKASDKGLDAAIERAKEEVRRQRRDAEARVNRKRLETERKILLKSITPAAEVLLESLPTGAEMLALEAGR